jgi:hypothetical protein
LTPAYPLVDWNRCVHENTVFVGYTGLFLLVFARRFFQVIDLCLWRSASSLHRCLRASYLCQGRPDGRDEETITALSRVSHVAFILALKAIHVLEMCMASRWHRDHNGSGSHFELRFLKCRSRVQNTSLVQPLCRGQVCTRMVQGRRDDALEVVEM